MHNAVSYATGTHNAVCNAPGTHNAVCYGTGMHNVVCYATGMHNAVCYASGTMFVCYVCCLLILIFLTSCIKSAQAHTWEGTYQVFVEVHLVNPAKTTIL